MRGGGAVTSGAKTSENVPAKQARSFVKGRYIRVMAKSPRVTFKPSRIAEGEWQIEAHYPGAEVRYVKGLTSKADVDEWLQGSRKVEWLRSQGYAK